MADIINLPSSYLAHRESMKTGDLIEWQSQTAFGYLIRLFSRQDVNHTSFLIRPSEFASYKDRRFMLEAMEPGVVPTLLSDRIANYKGKVYWIPVKDGFMTDGDRQKIADYAIIRMCEDRSAGKGKYDIPGLIKQAAGRVSMDAQRFFCSEWVQYIATERSVIPRLDYALRPGEFHGKFEAYPKRILFYDSEDYRQTFTSST